MKRPCTNCPFRNGRAFGLTKARAREIADALKSNRAFYCHETVDYETHDEDEEGCDGVVTSKSQFCMGAAAVLHNDTGNAGYNQMVRFATRFGGMSYDDIEASTELVYPTFTAFIKDQG